MDEDTNKLWKIGSMKSKEKVVKMSEKQVCRINGFKKWNTRP